MNPFPLESETGEFIYAPYGSIAALYVRGDEAFLERAYNLINNFSDKQITCRRSGEYHYYIITTTELLDRITLYYRCQMRSKDFDSEETMMTLARAKANDFWTNSIKHGTIERPRADIPYVYGLGRLGGKSVTNDEMLKLYDQSITPSNESCDLKKIMEEISLKKSCGHRSSSYHEA